MEKRQNTQSELLLMLLFTAIAKNATSYFTYYLLHTEAWPHYTHLIAVIYLKELSLVHYFIICRFSLQ